MDADKLFLKYIDVIEDAFDLGITPETLKKMVWSNKTKPDIKIRVLAASLKFIRSNYPYCNLEFKVSLRQNSPHLPTV